MATELEFEVRLIGAAFAVVGEGVTFREENGKLLALNEDGEPFGVVPNRYAEQLRELEECNSEIVATVVSHGDGVLGVAVSCKEVRFEAEQVGIGSASEIRPESEQVSESVDSVAAADKSVRVMITATPESPDEINSESDEQSSETTTSAQYKKSDSSQGSKKKTKYVLIGMLLAALVVVIIICIVAFSDGGRQTVTDGTISIEVPSSWEVEEDSDGDYLVIESESETVRIMLATELQDYSEDAISSTLNDVGLDESDLADFITLTFLLVFSDSGYGLGVDSFEKLSTDEGVLIYAFDSSVDIDDTEYSGTIELIFSGESISVVIAMNNFDASDDDIASMEEALASVTVLDPSEPAFLSWLADGEEDDEVSSESEEESEEEGQTVGTETISDSTLSIEYPSDWEVVDSDSDSVIVRTLAGEVIVDFVSTVMDGNLNADAIASTVIEAEIESAPSNGSLSIDEDVFVEETSEDGVLIRSYEVCPSYDGSEYEGTCVMFFSGDSFSVLMGICLTDALDEYEDELNEVMASATVLDPSEPNYLSDEEASDESDNEEVAASDETQIISDGSYSVEVPSTWTVENVELDSDSSYDAEFRAYSSDGDVYLTFATGLSTSDVDSLDALQSQLEESNGFDSETLVQTVTSEGVVVCRYDVDLYGDGTWIGYIRIYFIGR